MRWTASGKGDNVSLACGLPCFLDFQSIPTDGHALEIQESSEDATLNSIVMADCQRASTRT